MDPSPQKTETPTIRTAEQLDRAILNGWISVVAAASERGIERGPGRRAACINHLAEILSRKAGQKVSGSYVEKVLSGSF